MVALVQGELPEDRRRRGGGGRGALARPKESGKVVCCRVNGALADVERVRDDVEVPEMSQELQL